MNNEILKYVLLIGFSVFGIINNSLDFNPIRFKCENYILNSYLYFLLSWGIILTTITTLYSKKIKLKDLFSGPFTILLFFSSLMLLVGLMFIPPQLFFTKHIMYIFYIILFGIMLYPYYVKNRTLFNYVALTTLAIILSLSIMAFINPNMIKDSWGYYLFSGLIFLLIARTVEIFTLFNKKNKKPSKWLSYVSIFIFSLYILYDTKKLMINAENCPVPGFSPDYINESLNLFLDSINIFTNVYNTSE